MHMVSTNPPIALGQRNSKFRGLCVVALPPSSLKTSTTTLGPQCPAVSKPNLMLRQQQLLLRLQVLLLLHLLMLMQFCGLKSGSARTKGVGNKQYTD